MQSSLYNYLRYNIIYSKLSHKTVSSIKLQLKYKYTQLSSTHLQFNKCNDAVTHKAVGSCYGLLHVGVEELHVPSTHIAKDTPFKT